MNITSDFSSKRRKNLKTHKNQLQQHIKYLKMPVFSVETTVLRQNK